MCRGFHLAVIFLCLALPAQAQMLLSGAGPVAAGDALTTLANSMCAGCWADAGAVGGVTAPTIASVAPSPIPAGTDGQVAVTRVWSGGALDTAHEMFLVWGGGHSDYCGNEVYGLTLSTLNWSRLTDPSTCDTNNTGVYADGRPASRHTYSSLVFIPGTTNKVMSNGGSVYISGAFDSKSFLFDPANLASPWSQAASNVLMAVADPMAIYNPADGNVYAIGGTSATSLQKYNVAGNSWSSIGGGIAGLPDSHQTGTIDRTNGRLIATGSTFLFYLDLATGALTNASGTSTGDKTCQNYIGPSAGQGAPGFVWYPGSSEPVCHVPGSATVYRLQWNAGSGTYNWLAQAPGAGNTVTPPAEVGTGVVSQGVYGRFQWDQAHGVFIEVIDTTLDTYVYKPAF